MSEVGHGHVDNNPTHRKVALLIAVLALLLALAETLAKGAQTSALSANIEAANLWSFFQAKTIRMTTVRTAAEAAEFDLLQASAESHKEAINKRVAEWKQSATRYDSEPETQEGRKELAARAKVAEARRDRTLAAYHQYEIASAAVQIAIVLASASIITGATVLVWSSGGLGLIGLAFCLIGLFWPTAVHLF
ncbi:MAG: DUF4337 domain-containing protein [Candidatus Tectomicrobia bacterium]|uniref:DUF4337 domain-containing protein n=1 Tax=Tectimicrobiota bacterium TaxID=2528274 RepID=A0A938B338_UNCTE|nr:DUF4337 domain-containing protein [Candidatus Tectomicrobia bacterium]